MDADLERLGREVARLGDAELAKRELPPVGGRLAWLRGARARERASERRGRRLAWSMALASAAAAALATFTYDHLGAHEPLRFEIGHAGGEGRPGAWMSASAAGELPVAFSDGTTLRLNPDARARVASVTGRGAHVVVERGRVDLDVVHRASTEWTVTLGPFDVHVTGTRFDASWDPVSEVFALGMREGSVRISGACLAQPRTAKKGESLRLSCNDPASLAAGPGAAPGEASASAAGAARADAENGGGESLLGDAARANAGAAQGDAAGALAGAARNDAARANVGAAQGDAARANVGAAQGDAARANAGASAPGELARAGAGALAGREATRAGATAPVDASRAGATAPVDASRAGVTASGDASRAGNGAAQGSTPNGATPAGAVAGVAPLTTAGPALGGGAPPAVGGAPRATWGSATRWLDASAPPAAAPARRVEAPAPAPVEGPAVSTGAPAAALPPPPSVSWQALAMTGDYQGALAAVEREGFESVLASANVAELKRLGDVARLAKATARARAAYEELRRRVPGGDLAAVAAFELGRIAFDDARAFGDARRWFAVYLSERPQGSLAQEALGRLFESQQRAGDREGARAGARAYLARYPNGPHAALAGKLVEP